MKKIGIGLLGLAGLLLVLTPVRAAVAPATSADRDANILTVTGTGEVRVVPDRAIVSAGVETRAAKAADAIQENNRVMGQVVAAIRKLGIPERDIQTATYNVSLQYEPGPRDTQPKPIYVVSNIVSVRLMDPARAGAVIDAATGAGANVVQGVTFTTDRENEARQQALQAAVREAQGKANAMAEALGVRLDGVASVDESGAPVIMASRMAVMAEAAAAPAAAPILPGENVVRASVVVRYRLAPR